MPTLDDAPFLDMFDEEFRADPAPVIAKFREQSWLVRTPIGVLVIGHERVHTLLSDSRLTSALLPMIRMQGVTDGPIHEMASSALLAIDGADHLRVRRLVSRSFTPRAVEPYRPGMRALVDSLVGQFAGAGQCEFMADFADRYPVQVICHVLGIPAEDGADFARWGEQITHALSLELSLHIDEVTAGFTSLNAYLDELIAIRQATPQDDLVSALIAASEDGDRLSVLELRSLIGGLLFAGYDTTRNQLGLAMTLFCEHPDQWRLLGSRPELAAPAVEEIMRIAGTVAVTPRVAMEDLDIYGWQIPAGTIVALSLAAANHDPIAYEDPDVFDITSTREPHFTFGGGPHYCLGASLARAEMQEALPVLARAMPDLALDGEPTWRSPTGIFGPTKLPLRFAHVNRRPPQGVSRAYRGGVA